jgi:microsomal dipeptidase-like Zn-dependent dipeptidase
MRPARLTRFIFVSAGTAAVAATALLGACGGSSAPDGAAPGVRAGDRYAMANGCFAVRELDSGRLLAVDGSAVRLAETGTPLFMKPTALGRYLFYTPDQRFLALVSPTEALGDALGGVIGEAGATVGGIGDMLALVNPALPVADGLNDAGNAIGDGGAALDEAVTGARTLGIAEAPSDGAEWTVDSVGGGFSIVSTLTGDALAIDGMPGRFDFVAQDGCTPYPEAQLNASGEPFKGRLADGTVFGYAETHMHLGGSEALGGRLGYGSPFHKFGIPHALGDCAVDHGPTGAFDALDAIVNPNSMFFPPHETQGWPTFRDWPSHGSQTHHQTYYVWLKRAWMGGLRFMMNHLVANEVICQIWPLKQHDCNEMDSIALQRQLVLDLQDYIDAQEGGPGKGFFRIVYDSAEARRVIEDGRMAVVLGTENEKIFDCGEFLDMPECTREHIDAELDRWYDLGLRAIFPIHLFDNALGGTRLTPDVALNVVYQGGNILETGHPFATIPCDEADATPPGAAPSQPPRGIIETVLLQATGLPPAPPITGCVENARGLTDLGDYFVNAMIDRGILIETDHSGTLSRKRILDIAAARDVPVLSGHTGFVSDARDTRRILEVGGIISNLPDDPTPQTIDFILQLEAAYRALFGNTEGLATGLGSDINGIHVQAAPRDDAAENPLVYPFRSYDGRVVFERQITGERVFDLNTDGVAHYGLYPDYLADLQAQPGGETAMQYLFRSAEAYLQAWERAERARVQR